MVPVAPGRIWSEVKQDPSGEVIVARTDGVGALRTPQGSTTEERAITAGDRRAPAGSPVDVDGALID